VARADRRGPADPIGLVERAQTGDVRARAKLFSLVEAGGADARIALDLLAPLTGRALVVGITGPPGAGKSTLVGGLAKAIRQAGETVAILAVDPSSPITGGAVLGDRIRMQDLHGDPGAFVRSLSTRGAMGGLAQAVGDMVTVADGLGYDVVMVETVGAGQDDADIAGISPTVVLVEGPHLGDDIQSIKAGVLEIASIYAVNKADRDGADLAAAILRAMLSLAHSRDGWNPPVLKVSALTGVGIDKLLAAIREHRAFLQSSGRLVSWPIERARRRLLDGFRDRVVETVLASIAPTELDRLVDEVAERRLSLTAAIDRLVQELDSSLGPSHFKAPAQSTHTPSSDRIHSIDRARGR
jgi:LAO/AO transport system kinase